MTGSNALGEWAAAMGEYLASHPDHDLTAEDVVNNAKVRAAALDLPAEVAPGQDEAVSDRG